MLSLPWIFKGLGYVLFYAAHWSFVGVRFLVRAQLRPSKVRELERHEEQIAKLWEKMIDGEELTAAEVKVFNRPPLKKEDWEWLGEPWWNYQAKCMVLKWKYNAAQAEREGPAREAQERAEREARERAERAAREQAQANAERERSEREWRKKTSGQEGRTLTEYESAVALLKLPQHFTRHAFNKAYRKAMASAHPDAGGTTSRAQAVNGARDLIRKKQRWS